MVVAIVFEDKVENLIVCDSIEIAKLLFPDAVCVVGDGLAIGDTVDTQQGEK